MLRNWILFFGECLTIVVVVLAGAYLWIEPHLKESFVQLMEARVGLEAEVDEFFFSPTGKINGSGLVFKGVHPELGELTFKAGSYEVLPKDNLYLYLWEKQDSFNWLDLSYDVEMTDISITGHHVWLQKIHLDELKVLLEPKGAKVSLESLSWKGKEGQAELENLNVSLQQNRLTIQLERLQGKSRKHKAELGGMAFDFILPKQKTGLIASHQNFEEWLSYIEDWRSTSILYEDQETTAKIDALRMSRISDSTWKLNAAIHYNEQEAIVDNSFERLSSNKWALRGKYSLEAYERVFDYSIEGPLKVNGPWVFNLNDRQKNYLGIDLSRNEQKDWIGTVNLDLEALRIPNIEGPVIAGKLKGGLRMTQKADLIKLSLNGNDLSGGPSMTREGELTLQMDWDRNKQLLQIVHLKAGEKNLWSASGNGLLRVKDLTPVSFDAQVKRFPLGKYSSTVGGDVDVEAKLNDQSLAVHVSCERLLPNGNPLEAMDKFSMKIFNDSEKVDFELSSIQRGMPNVIALKADVKDLLIEPEKLKLGKLKYFQVMTDLFDLQLQEEVPVTINIMGLALDYFHLDDMNLCLRDLKGRAYIPFFEGSKVMIRAEGELDLAHMPQIADTEARGKIKVLEAEWLHSWALRNLSAKLKGSEIQLIPSDFLPEIQVSSVVGRLEDSKIFIDALNGKTKEGQLKVAGVYDFVRRWVGFDVAAKSIAYSQDDYDLLYDVDHLSIQGETLDLMVQGNLLIKDLLYNRDVSLNDSEAQLRHVMMRPPEALDVRHRLDLKIMSPEPLFIDNNVARLKFISDGLRVYGPLSKPKWTGSIVTVDNPKNLVILPVQFLDVSMQAKKLRLQFQDQDEWNPLVSLDAQVEVDDVDIFLKYEGKMDDIYNGNYQLSSLPAFTRQEILALLGTGDRPNQAPFKGANETQQSNEAPSITLIKSNQDPVQAVPISYQASVSSGQNPFEFRIDYRLSDFLGLELSQSADESAFAGLRFSKNMSRWSELLNFKSGAEIVEKEEKIPVRWKLKGMTKLPFDVMPDVLKTQLRKLVNPSLIAGEYDLARQRIEKIMNAFLMEKGYRDATYTVKELSRNSKQIIRRNAQQSYLSQSIEVEIQVELGRPYVLYDVDVQGCPESIRPTHPWLQKKPRRLRLLKMKEVELFKQSLLRSLADQGYPSAQVDVVELQPVQLSRIEQVDEAYENLVIEEPVQGLLKLKDGIPLKLRLGVSVGEKHQLVQMVIEGIEALTEEQAKEVMGHRDGSVYSESRIEHYQRNLLAWYASQGFFGTQVILDQALRSRSYPRVSLHFEVSEGRRWRCGQIYFKGLKEIGPEYLFSKFSLKPGEWMDPLKVQGAFAELSRTEIVGAVEHRWIDTDESDVRDLEINIQEISKLRVAMRLGYESGEGLQYALRVKEYHLGGLGRSLAYESNFSAKEQLHLLRYEIPELPFDHWRTQFIVANEVTRLSKLELRNTANIYGFSLSERDKTRKLDHDFFYKEDRNFEGYEPSLRYRLSLSKSNVDLPDQPGKGFGYRVKSTLVDYLERDGYYYYGDYRMSYGFKLGGSMLTPWSRLAHSQDVKASFAVPFADRYFLGGSKSLRGYGQEEISGSKGLGGESLWAGGLELFYPVHRWMDGSLFYEVGRLYDGNLELPLEKAFHSIGLGLLFRTPVGPVQGYFAHPLGDGRLGRLGLQLGTIF